MDKLDVTNKQLDDQRIGLLEFKLDLIASWRCLDTQTHLVATLKTPRRLWYV